MLKGMNKRYGIKFFLDFIQRAHKESFDPGNLQKCFFVFVIHIVPVQFPSGEQRSTGSKERPVPATDIQPIPFGIRFNFADDVF